MDRLIRTNLLGTIHGSRAAMRGMLAQGGGAIYNLEGWGSDGKRRGGLAVYGTSKCAIRYFTLALADEAAGTPVLVGTLSPGMMVTGFLTGPMGRMSPARPGACGGSSTSSATAPRPWPATWCRASFPIAGTGPASPGSPAPG